MSRLTQPGSDGTETGPTEAEMNTSVRFGIRSKLTFMVAGPVVVLLVVVFTQISGRMNVVFDMHELWELVPFVELTSDLVHEIQTERDLGALFLGSAGTEFGEELEEQYRRTDESVALLTEALLHGVEDDERFLEPLELVDGTPLLEAANPIDIFPHLEDLEEHRSSVRSLTSDEMENLTFYSSLNDRLLDLGVELTRWAPDLGIVNLIWAHNSMAKTSETAGQERAVLGHAIATGDLSRDGLARLAGLISSQNAHLDVFSHHAPSDIHDLYHEKLEITLTPSGLHDDQGTSSIIFFREAAVSGDLSGLDAAEWWTAASARIDVLDELDKRLLEDIVAEGLILRSDAWASVARFSVFALLALFGVVVAWLLGGRLARRMRSLTAVAAAISSGDLDQRADPGGRDELGILGESLNDMADHLTKLITDKNQFIATVAHELRTPLTTVMGYSDLLRSDSVGLSPEERNSMVDTIYREASELSSLIQDLLVAARATDGSLVVAEVRVNLKAQATQVIESLEPETSTTVKVIGETTLATGDPMRVRQILRNLISNAMKYGGSHIEVRAHDGEHQVSVFVTDDGRGIDVKDRDLVFEPYETLQAAEARPGSMGLGLAVSRTLARLMGGDLAYRYDNGESLFELTLPAWRSADPDLESASAARSPTTRETFQSALADV